MSGAADSLPLAHDAPAASKALAATPNEAEKGTAATKVSNLGVNTQSRGPWAVFKDVWPQASSVGYSFFVTLALFPGITSKMQSSHFSVESGWYPIILITLFNACDLTGRTLPRCVWERRRAG